jgi:hypothetical protein
MVPLFTHNADLLLKPQLMCYREQFVSVIKIGSSKSTSISQRTSFLSYRTESWYGIMKVHRTSCKVSVIFN